VRTCSCGSTKNSRSAWVDPQQRVWTRSCRSTEKTRIRWCKSTADLLKQIHRAWCGPARADLLKNMWTHSSRSAQPWADPLRSNNGKPFVFANHRPFSGPALVYFATWLIAAHKVCFSDTVLVQVPKQLLKFVYKLIKVFFTEE